MRDDIGVHSRRARVVECRALPEGGFDWVQVGSVWVRPSRARVNRVFAKIGFAAEGWDLSMRACRLRKTQALRIGAEHFTICDILPPENGYMVVETALTPVCMCVGNAEVEEKKRFTFPGILTELYIKHEQREPMSVNIIDYVLVTPKLVELRPGSLVDIGGVRYEVLTAHTLDTAKNEYQIRKVRDL